MRIDEVRNLDVQSYEDIYSKLKKCFNIYFGEDINKGILTMWKVRREVDYRRRRDKKHNLPENRLIEIPKEDPQEDFQEISKEDHALYNVLKDTYISRDESYASGMIGCVETPEEQLDGITNMTLLMFLSNHLSKEYKKRMNLLREELR